MNLPNPLYKVELIAKNRAHYYRVEGERDLYPGVTGALGMIAKPALIPWAAKQAAENIKAYLMANAVNRPLDALEIAKLVEEGKKAHVEAKDKAADLGTRAHAAINSLIEGGTMDLTDDIRLPVEAFMEFVAKDYLRLERGDMKIASKVYQYGGSLDALGVENGRFVIVDFKTSSGIWQEYALQVAAYAKALQETYGLDYTPEALILRFGKTKPEFEVKRVRNINACFEQFLAALKLYHGSKMEVFEAA